MKTLTQVIAFKDEDNRQIVETAGGYLTRTRVKAVRVGKLVALKEDSGFKQRLRSECPTRANAYELQSQLGGNRYVQFYRILNQPRGLTFRAPRIAYDPECENNCIPGVPK